MENKNFIIALSIFIVGLLAVSLIAASGMGFISGNKMMSKTLSDEEKSAFQKIETDIKAAIENNDYATWKSLMEQRLSRMQSELTQDNFNTIVAMHKERQTMHDEIQKAKESGDRAALLALKEKYGFNDQAKGLGKGIGNGMGKGRCMDEGIVDED